MHDVRQSNSHRVAGALRREIADVNQIDLGRLVSVSGLKCHATANDLGVHPGAADVLAHFIDDQQIEL